MANSPTLTIRIPADLKRALARAAAAEDRSVTSFVVHALRLAVEQAPAERELARADARARAVARAK